MPQINKIRIVNFSYDDGKRFIPDELYDLSAESGEALNSLFNLVNGGGKTVLVQLIMQPVNPKAMAGGRRIEDYFIRPTDHSFVILEWNTDNSKDKLLTGIAIAGSSSSSQDDSQRGNSIRYYTFMTEYENYSPYSIASLELSKNENGKYVPAGFDYIREKAKASKGVLEYYSSDDSAKWTSKLSEYGILRSEWKTVIEELNKDEGGLNQYFEEAKTSDKLISKFFIPAIEQKMKSVATSGTDSSLETMLINYAQKISEKENVIRERDTNRKLLNKLGDLRQMSEELYSVNDNLMQSVGDVYGFKAAVSMRTAFIDEETMRLSDEIKTLDNQIRHIEHEEKSREYYESNDEYEQANAKFQEAQSNLEMIKKDLQIKKHEEDILQSAKLYTQIKDTENKMIAIKRLIEEKENDSEDAEQIAKLKYSVYVKANEESSRLSQEISDKEKLISEREVALKDCENQKIKAEAELSVAKEKYSSAEANLNAAKAATDARVNTLNIEAIRMFDGFYAEKEIKREKQKREEEKETITTTIENLKSDINSNRERKEQITKEDASIDIKLAEKSEELKNEQEKLDEYNKSVEILGLVCDKYSLERTAVFTGRLLSVLKEDREMTRAGIKKLEQDIHNLQERFKAAKEGHVHILPDIMKHVISTGIRCITGEEYMCGLLESGNITKEKYDEVLLKYPEMAFSLLFYNEKDLKRFIKAGNIDWLPALVPLYTMEQVNELIDGKMSTSNYLAVYDKSYFNDRIKYADRVSEEISSKEEQGLRLRNRFEECEIEERQASEFSYSEDWKSLQEKRIESLKEQKTSLNNQKEALVRESETIKENLKLTESKLETENRSLQESDKWLDSFAELDLMISAEIDWDNKRQKAYSDREKASAKYKKSFKAYEAAESELTELRKENDEKKKLNEGIKIILDSVGGAKETFVIEGDLEGLYGQYQTMINSLSESTKKLKDEFNGLQIKKADDGKELQNYSCEKSEYENVRFLPDALLKVKHDVKQTENKKEERQSVFDECNRIFASSEQRLKASKNALDEYEGKPLPKNEIGEDFKVRISRAKNKEKDISDSKDTLEKEKQSLERIRGRVDDKLGEYQFGEIVPKEIELSITPELQWKALLKSFDNNRKDYDSKKGTLLKSIETTIGDFKNVAIAEIVGKLKAIGEMLDDTGLKGDRLFTVCEGISAMIASIEKINSKIETDLREIENDFEDIVNHCMTQGKRMYLDLKNIAASSKVNIFEGKPQTQMIKLSLPDEKEISEEASRVSIKAEIDLGANEICDMIKEELEEKQILKRAKQIVSSERLLHKYIRQESISVKVYKIDMNSANSAYKRWEDTLIHCSGAEKFVVFFSVVLTLINYTRSSAGFINRNAKSVLVLDNPFGKITSAHLLKPMFDIAKHFNVQLICLSDINKSDVVSCFDCVMKLTIKSQNLSNFEILTHEGNERIEHGYYKIMNGQLSFF